MLTYSIQGRKRLLNIVGYEYLFGTILVDTNGLQVDNCCWLHNYRIDKILTLLKNSYDIENSRTDIKYITSEEFNRGEIVSLIENNQLTGSVVLGICIARGSGGIYLYSSYYGRIKLIFRFTNLENAVRFYRYIYNDNIGAKGNKRDDFFGIGDSIATLSKYIGENIDYTNIYVLNNYVINIYKYQMEGYPKDYPLSGFEKELWDLIAKQPKEQ